MKVVCIDNRRYKNILTVNKVYDVVRNDGEDVVVVGDDGARRYVFSEAHFKPITIIKMVRYVKEPCAYVSNIELGNMYDVVEETEDGFYIIINDKNMTAMIPKNCFEDIPRTITLKLDTTTLQAQLSQAIHHLEELNRILGELGIGIEDIKVIRND